MIILNSVTAQLQYLVFTLGWAVVGEKIHVAHSVFCSNSGGSNVHICSQQ